MIKNALFYALELYLYNFIEENSIVEDFLNELNDSQREAAAYMDGPALVIAGAGSGKTRVLTYKIAYLLHQGLPPQSILALTFTNKAAREMKERVGRIMGADVARRLWMGTFHSVFSRILRAESGRLGYPSNYTIYDTTDSKNLIKSIIKEMQLDDKMYRPGMVHAHISNAKNALITSQAYMHNKELVEHDMKARVPLIRDIYARYQNRCFQAGAMDFDDLLMQTNILFRDHPDVLEKYRGFFKYILVDEYQDTNFAQHLIVQRLSETHGHICVVGDDAQSIYSFRGANLDNILQFRNIYKGCRIFKLERNYRSTRNIVDAANSLIHKNKEQIQKTVYSEKELGNRIGVSELYSDYEEAYSVATGITELKNGCQAYNYSDIAVLYRTNAQSRILEEAMRKRNIPYRIYGGLSFYQRKEVKDVISYFRLIVNPNDEEAFKRIINYPARGIGDTTVGKLVDAATTHNVSLWTVLCALLDYALPVNSGTEKKLNAFREMILQFREYDTTLPLDETVDLLMKQSGIMAFLAQDTSVEGTGKYENVKELVKGVIEFGEMMQEEGAERVTLTDFLSEVALLTDQDIKEEHPDRVTLMTIHAAKGLEFKNVFIVGLEEDLFPSLMSRDSQRAIEEERRLFYVAITRAEENCFLSYAKSRFRNGQYTVCSQSRFLKDIDSAFLDRPSAPERTDSFSYNRDCYKDSKPHAATPSIDQSPAPHLKRVSRATVATTSSAATDITTLIVGARVKHDRFGEGYIQALEENGGNMKAVVEFDNFGTKQLLLKFAKLTVLS